MLKSVFFIIIAGGTASGKTTVANKIANILLKDKPVRKPINVPIYDFKNHCRSNKTIELKPADVIILDGILALHIKEIRDFGDLKIFIKTEDDVRFIRRLERDIYERGRTIENVIKQYLTTVKPMHDLFVAPSMDLADIIIPYYE
ncbi:uncharacterized protein LOC111273240, partial [Varroa jacobsoni]|uniref:uncharacterized protein LOC111273240 n=1 Tax=Varroa jacobsoni TaxID=62625 RepID=UPI000BF287F6